MDTINIGEDTLISLSLTSTASGSAVEGATATMELTSITGSVIVDDISLSEVSSGLYQGYLSDQDTMNLIEGRKYYINVAVVAGETNSQPRLVVVARYNNGK